MSNLYLINSYLVPHCNHYMSVCLNMLFLRRKVITQLSYNF